jgi:hypothetical protein
MPFVKLLVILLLLGIVASLGVALVQMMRSGGTSDRTVKALTLRVALSIGLFALLIIGFATGLISPHGL